MEGGIRLAEAQHIKWKTHRANLAIYFQQSDNFK